MKKIKTFIIVVNYNNWKDTIICIEDILVMNWLNTKILLVDNGSTDDSILHFNQYLNGGERDFVAKNYPDWKNNEKKLELNKSKIFDITLIESQSNNGYASGINLGIKFARTLSNNYFYLWILNNDIVVDKNSLIKLIEFYKTKDYGLVGSKVLDFLPPHRIQSLYGSFNKYSGNNQVINSKNSKKRISYPIGCSLFTSSEIIENVGLFDENYFLYYEELDYSTRIIKKGFEIGIADKSIVYHKQGATTKSKRNQHKKNLKIEKHKYKGLIIFYKKNYPKLIYAAYLQLIFLSLKNLLKGNFRNFKNIIGVISSSYANKDQ